MLKLVFSRETKPTEWAEKSDRELLRALRDDDEQALNALIERKTPALVQLAYRVLGDFEEAKDVVQVSFFRIWENRQKFDERWSPNTLIYRIVNNLAIDQLRSRKSRERTQEPIRLHLRQVATSSQQRRLSSLDQGEVSKIFDDLAGHLTDKQRSVFVLREIEGLSSKEVGDILGCRESTVRNHLFNARKVLRRTLKERYPEYARGWGEGGE